MTAAEAILAVHAFNPRHVVPVHYEGWAHLSQGKDEVTVAFDAAGLSGTLVWLEPSRPTSFSN